MSTAFSIILGIALAVLVGIIAIYAMNSGGDE